MRLNTFHAFALTALAQAPDVQTAEPWDRGAEHLRGLSVRFTSGAQVKIGVTSTAAPGDRWEGPEIPVEGEPPSHWPYPQLYENGKTTTGRAQEYLAAAVTNSGDRRIAEAYGYKAEGQGRGFAVLFHDGAKAFCLFHHTD